MVLIDTDKGKITVRLYNETPQHHDNFIKYKGLDEKFVAAAREENMHNLNGYRSIEDKNLLFI